ncbi:MAG TPA: Uma2 family endonuclease [Gemmataceae bacterium]|nr:Uma2 family endonuclease [Gemmataceae bacterium]
MSTVLKKLGPADHGRPMTLEEFMAASSVEGYHYELIDGELYVSPEANLPEFRVENWMYFKLGLYAQEHPRVINFVANKARVFVPGRRRVTTSEPDLAAYRNFPLHRPIDSVRWQDVSPILVVEVLSLDDPDKDLVRNVGLYLQVPSIKEYWLFDTREGAEQLRLQVRRRYRGQWSLRQFAPGDTYTTKLLSGFTLVLDPRS